MLCLVEARFPAGTHETYQVPLGLRPADEGWDDRVILETDGWTVYDALADPAHGRELLHRMRSNTELQVGQDEFIFRWAESAGAGLGGTVDVRPVGVEQSNSSIVFGEDLILKAFRRVEPGVNPELELLRFLSARGFPHIAPLAGWYEVEGRLIDATLGILQEYLADAQRRLGARARRAAARPRGPARAPARRSASWSGELHTALGSDSSNPAFSPDEPSAEALSHPHRERRRADRARVPRPAGDRRAGADRRPRPGRARAAAGAVARRRRRARDPHARRPAPRPDDADRAAAG